MVTTSGGFTMKYSYSMEAAVAHYPDAYKFVPFESGVIVFLTELAYHYHKAMLKTKGN